MDHWKSLAQAGSIVLALWIVFGSNVAQSYELFYLLFLPTIWIAVRHGIAGATGATLVLDMGAMVMLKIVPEDMQRLGMLQFLMLIVSLTGLCLGALITESGKQRTRTADSEARLQAMVGAIDEIVFEFDRRGNFPQRVDDERIGAGTAAKRNAGREHRADSRRGSRWRPFLRRSGE